VGQFVKARQYPDATLHDVTAPNADTLYTTAWLDVGREPWVGDWRTADLASVGRILNRYPTEEYGSIISPSSIGNRHEILPNIERLDCHDACLSVSRSADDDELISIRS
jgi:hypothetical protein